MSLHSICYLDSTSFYSPGQPRISKSVGVLGWGWQWALWVSGELYVNSIFSCTTQCSEGGFHHVIWCPYDHESTCAIRENCFMVSFSIPKYNSHLKVCNLVSRWTIYKVFFNSIVLWSDFKEKSQLCLFSCSSGISVIICKKLVTIVVLGERNLLFSLYRAFFALSFFLISCIIYYY